MNKLLTYYSDKLTIIETFVKKNTNNGSIHDEKRKTRLETEFIDIRDIVTNLNDTKRTILAEIDRLQTDINKFKEIINENPEYAENCQFNINFKKTEIDKLNWVLENC